MAKLKGCRSFRAILDEDAPWAGSGSRRACPEKSHTQTKIAFRSVGHQVCRAFAPCPVFGHLPSHPFCSAAHATSTYPVSAPTFTSGPQLREPPRGGGLSPVRAPTRRARDERLLHGPRSRLLSHLCGGPPLQHNPPCARRVALRGVREGEAAAPEPYADTRAGALGWPRTLVCEPPTRA